MPFLFWHFFAFNIAAEHKAHGGSHATVMRVRCISSMHTPPMDSRHAASLLIRPDSQTCCCESFKDSACCGKDECCESPPLGTPCPYIVDRCWICACAGCSSWGHPRIKIARMTLTVKLNRNWSSFQLANCTPPLSVTGSTIAPSTRINN